MTDQELMVAMSSVLVFVVMMVAFLMFILHRFQKTRIAAEKEKFELQARFSKDLMLSQIEIQNQTLKSVGEDLHDNIGQLLSVLRINLSSIEEENKNPEIKAAVSASTDLLEKSISEVRLLSKSLNTDHLEQFGLLQNIETELERLRKTRRFETQLKTEGAEPQLGKDKEIILFRIFQEAINNAIKHAKPKKIEVLAKNHVLFFQLVIKNDGKHFNPQFLMAQSGREGSGLRNMKARSETIGGQFSIVSAEKEGTTISINISKTDI